MSTLTEKIGKYDVLVSNSLNVFKFEDVILTLQKDDSALAFRVKFINEGKDPSISTHVAGEEMTIEMHNVFYYPGGLSEPIEVATTDDEKQNIFLMCSVLPLNKNIGSFIFFYSFLSLLKE